MKHTRRNIATGGFTMIELLISMLAVSVIMIGVISIMYILIENTKEDYDQRLRSVTTQIATMRISDAIRSASACLGSTDTAIVLWRGDANLDSLPCVSEMSYLQWDEPQQQLLSFQASEMLLSSSDATYPLSSDFTSLAQELVGNGLLEPRVIIDRLADINISRQGHPESTEDLVLITLEWSDDMQSKPTRLSASTRGGG